MNTEIKIIGGITILTLAILFGAVFFFSRSDTQTVVDNALLIRDDSWRIASSEAKLTIVEFADFQCPACAVAQPTVKQAEAEYQGRVSFVFRHFPLSQHRNGFSAAKASEAAGEQGKFFEMGSLLYQNQIEWEELSNPESKFLSYAQSLNLDVEKFKASYNSDKFNSKINQDIADGNSVGVRGTPTFFFNGQQYKGRLDYPSFKAAIEAYLK